MKKLKALYFIKISINCFLNTVAKQQLTNFILATVTKKMSLVSNDRRML